MKVKRLFYVIMAIVLLVGAMAVWPPLAAGQEPSPDVGIKHHDPSWRAEYFNNVYLSGAPVLVRAESAIDFDWGWGSPAPEVPADYFSARWTRTLDLPANHYVFTVTVDDGVRLWVDGRLLIDQWRIQPPTPYSAQIYLDSGHHVVQMEYYENTEGAVARLYWQAGWPPPLPTSPPPPPPTPVPFPQAWQGEYFNNRYLQGPPLFVRYDMDINFDWGFGSPGGGLWNDEFSIRWTRALYLPAGNYRFSAITDDGVRLQVDNHVIIDQWYDQGGVTYKADIYLLEGQHTVIMEYYEHGGQAMARLSWETIGPGPVPTVQPPPPPPPPPVPPGPYQGWWGEYFNNLYLSGYPLFTRWDTYIDFDWGWSGPGGGLPNDNFSVRWSGQINVPTSGQVTFYAHADDGVRVWADGQLVIDRWYDHEPTTYSGTIYLYAGSHQVKVEYYEHYDRAVIKLWWQLGGGVCPVSSEAIVIDDGDPGFTPGGPWDGWQEVALGYGRHMLWTYNSRYECYNFARWTPRLPRAGHYEVYAYIPGNYATSLRARYRIFHSGLRHDRIINQSAQADQWVSLGSYYFSAAGGEFVFLSDNTREAPRSYYVGFDAVKFVPR